MLVLSVVARVSSMCMQHSVHTSADEAGFWLSLKSAWEGWCADDTEFRLDLETLGYFESLAGKYFRMALGSDGFIAHLGYRMESDREAWAHVLTYLFMRRAKSTGAYLMDDIFERAFRKAEEQGIGGSLESVLGFIKNQFSMRVRGVVRDWIREQSGTTAQRNHKVSLDAPVGNDDSGQGGVLHQTLPGQETVSTDEAELELLGLELGRSVFEDADRAARVVTYLRSLKSVSLADGRITTVLGKGKSVLYEKESQVRQQLVERSQAVEEDDEGTMKIAVAAFQEFQIRCRDWFFSEFKEGMLLDVVNEKAPDEMKTFQLQQT